VSRYHSVMGEEAVLTFERVWLPYIYLYGVGGVAFFGGLFMVLRSEGFRRTDPRHRRWVGILVFGFVWYAAIHGIGTLAALYA